MEEIFKELPEKIFRHLINKLKQIKNNMKTLNFLEEFGINVDTQKNSNIFKMNIESYIFNIHVEQRNLENHIIDIEYYKIQGGNYEKIGGFL
ncbi:MAG: hypothetical protein ACRCY7_00030 [Cetobacterium sp.]|uniref:hypothetical protein n=1 Tax=Cetobacterium sp. TaxID=2071632 RepID=UPI003F305C40